MELTALYSFTKGCLFNMSNAKSDNRFVAAFKVLFAETPKTKTTTSNVVVNRFVKEEEEKVVIDLTEEETAMDDVENAAIEAEEKKALAAQTVAKLLAAKRKMVSERANRAVNAKLMLHDSLLSAEKEALDYKLALMESAERIANQEAEAALAQARLDALYKGEVHDLSFVEASLEAEQQNDAAQKARLAALLHARRNTAAPVGGKSYTSKANDAGKGAGDNGEKTESRRAIAFKALKAAGLSKELANEVLNFTYDNKVDVYVQTLLAQGKVDFLNKVSAIMMSDEGAYAPRWERALAANASAPAGATGDGQDINDDADDKASPDDEQATGATPEGKKTVIKDLLPKRA